MQWNNLLQPAHRMKCDLINGPGLAFASQDAVDKLLQTCSAYQSEPIACGQVINETNELVRQTYHQDKHDGTVAKTVL